MMTEKKLKELIDAYIKKNGKNEITGPVLNAVLNEMADSLVPRHPEPLPIVVKRAIPIHTWRPGQAYRMIAIRGRGALNSVKFLFTKSIDTGIQDWLNRVLEVGNIYNIELQDSKTNKSYMREVSYSGNLSFNFTDLKNRPPTGSYYATLPFSNGRKIAEWDGKEVTTKILEDYKTASPYLEVRKGRVVCVKNIFTDLKTNVILRYRHHSKRDPETGRRQYRKSWSKCKNVYYRLNKKWKGSRIRVIPTCKGIRSIYFKEVGRGFEQYSNNF